MVELRIKITERDALDITLIEVGRSLTVSYCYFSAETQCAGRCSQEASHAGGIT